MHSLSQGDELCWNGDSVEAAEISEGIHEYRTDASKNANADGDAMVSFDGGMMGSHRKPLMDPTKMAEEEEEECKEIFTDFATVSRIQARIQIVELSYMH